MEHLFVSPLLFRTWVPASADDPNSRMPIIPRYYDSKVVYEEEVYA
ncbi:Protein of unknown function, partial [Gryllus bimaculatus]